MPAKWTRAVVLAVSAVFVLVVVKTTVDRMDERPEPRDPNTCGAHFLLYFTEPVSENRQDEIKSEIRRIFAERYFKYTLMDRIGYARDRENPLYYMFFVFTGRCSKNLESRVVTIDQDLKANLPDVKHSFPRAFTYHPDDSLTNFNEFGFPNVKPKEQRIPALPSGKEKPA